MPLDVAVVGLEDENCLNTRLLHDCLRGEEDIRYHAVIHREETVIEDASYPFDERLDRARARMRKIPGGADGLVTYWDFPSSVFATFLANEAGLPYATVPSVIKCEHKLWFRQEQDKALGSPGFCGFRPLDEDPLSEVTLDYPFWIKPVVGHSSMLGFLIEGPEDFAKACAEIREHIADVTRPFRYVIEHGDLPEDLARLGASACLAEEIISHGEQYTLEGYVRHGEVVVYGIVQSVRDENEHTFSRYQYPASIEPEAARRMEEMTRKVLTQFGFDGSPFNVEFFHDRATGAVRMLEINSRLSQSHADLFNKVDGRAHFQIAVDLALDRDPRWRRGEGAFDVAAKFFLRRTEDGRVTKVPDRAMLDQLAREMPDVEFVPGVSVGDRLSELPEQETYSYEIADLFIGGRDEADLQRKFERSKEILRFEFGE